MIRIGSHDFCNLRKESPPWAMLISIIFSVNLWLADCSYLLAPDLTLFLLILFFCRPISSIELKDDTVIVVLGASGDLAKKKTVSF